MKPKRFEVTIDRCARRGGALFVGAILSFPIWLCDFDTEKKIEWNWTEVELRIGLLTHRLTISFNYNITTTDLNENQTT